jgi:hypothetical protein
MTPPPSAGERVYADLGEALLLRAAASRGDEHLLYLVRTLSDRLVRSKIRRRRIASSRNTF